MIVLQLQNSWLPKILGLQSVAKAGYLPENNGVYATKVMSVSTQVADSNPKDTRLVQLGPDKLLRCSSNCEEVWKMLDKCGMQKLESHTTLVALVPHVPFTCLGGIADERSD
jgi:hypothetical protein